jgi:uncharacterized membrane protein
MVEALTIVLAVGMTRGWRSTGLGAASAVVLLTLVVVALGPALTVLPIDTLRVVVGTILLIFGLQWLRKACLRAAGLKALHDESLVFQQEVQEAREAGRPRDQSHDWYAFTVAFKGVFLEGLEVAFIVITIGGAQHNVALAAVGAAGAGLVVLAAGLIVHQPLSRVPENTIKFVVGVMLTTFGVFWASEGAGVEWPGGDVALLGVLAYVAAVSALLVAATRRRHVRLLAAELAT